MGTVHRYGQLALKWDDPHSPSAERGRHLHRAGVRTPEPFRIPHRHALATPWLTHETGTERLTDAWMRGDEAALGRLLAVIADVTTQIHEAAPGGLSLPSLTRRRRIDARLPHAAAADIERAREILAGVSPVPGGPGSRMGLVHGDCHAGQFLFTDADTPWVVDVHDLAIGPPEHDIGNFIAHLATTGLGGSPTEAVWLRLETATCKAFGTGDDTRADIRDHTATALVRRALKLAERGNREHADATWRLARETLSRRT